MKVVARPLLIEQATTAMSSDVFINNSCDVLGLQIEGTFSAVEVIVKGSLSDSGDTWFELGAIDLGNLAKKTPTVDAQGLYEIPIETAYRVRVDVVSVSGGYVSVYGQFANTAV